jgi:dipeptidyl aminopeptidase/acylaminoacyl peptidase
MRTLLALAFFVLLSAIPGNATPSPDKKPLDHSVYDSWNRISGECISNDGKWIVLVIEPQEGDGKLVLYNVATGKADTVARGAAPKISEDSRFVVFSIKPFFADVRKAKIAKKKGDDLPKDSLGIVEFGKDTVVRIARVKSFKLPEKGGGWVAYHLAKEEAKKDSTRSAGFKDLPTDAQGDDKDKKDEPGTTLVVRDLRSGAEYRFPFVNEYTFSRNGLSLFFASTGNDSTVTAGVFLFATSLRQLDTLSIGKGKYKQLASDEEGAQAAFTADRDTSQRKQRYFALYYWKTGSDSARVIADTLTRGFPRGWLVSENRTPSFSKNGMRLLFGTAPVPMPDDTTMNDEVTAKLDVWNWKDGLLQTQQVHNLDEERKRAYLAAIDLASSAFTQLGTLEMPEVVPGDEGNADVALGLSDIPYRQLISWDDSYHDVYVVNTRTGAATKIIEKLEGGASLSPRARFVVWYNLVKRHWFALDTRTLTTHQITTNITVPLYNELNDIPDEPDPHGLAGWTDGDSTVLVYDRFDIWTADPTGLRPAVNLTAGAGRSNAITYRYVRTDIDERFIRNGKPMLLSAFDRTSKSAGFSMLSAVRPAAPQRLIMEPHMFSSPIKADSAGTYIFTRSSFTECPDLYVSGVDFTSPKRITDINPQQNMYLWGTVELVKWKATDNTPLEGLLYKPENFDPKRKYPLLVYYYERNSDLLNRYVPPAPSRSTINFPYCVSNGYLVFVPDIRYRVGHPGKSAYECIIPGVQSLIARGFVDPARMGLQGQSWGGYQTAYLVTRTSMFRAAMAGAPVANMTSAYGGIRWESGQNRMFQYERSQSRIGATLWERRDLFIENSPLFFADKVTTPLLIMANDGDGAVPWYQGIELFTALRRLGKQTWMLVYNNEEHNLTLRKNTKDLSIRMMQFFDYFLKDAPIPEWMSEGIPAINKGKTLGLELEKK